MMWLAIIFSCLFFALVVLLKSICDRAAGFKKLSDSEREKCTISGVLLILSFFVLFLIMTLPGSKGENLFMMADCSLCGCGIYLFIYARIVGGRIRERIKERSKLLFEKQKVNFSVEELVKIMENDEEEIFNIKKLEILSFNRRVSVTLVIASIIFAVIRPFVSPA